jgi:hypothetical protein
LDSGEFEEGIQRKGFWQKFAGIAVKSLKIAALAVFGGIPAIIWGVGIILLFMLSAMAINFVVGAAGTASVVFFAIYAAIKTAVEILNPGTLSIRDSLQNNFMPVVYLFLNSMIRTLSIGTVFLLEDPRLKDQNMAFLDKAVEYKYISYFLLVGSRGLKKESKGTEDVYKSKDGKPLVFTETKDILKTFAKGEVIIPFAKVIGCIKNEVQAIKDLARDTRSDESPRQRESPKNAN